MGEQLEFGLHLAASGERHVEGEGEEYVMQVDLESTTREMAEMEAESLIVIPYAALDDLLTLLDGRQLREGETIAGVIENVKSYI